MPNTTTLALPYPAPSAAPDVPGDIYALALRLDNVLGNFRLNIVPNTVLAGENGATLDTSGGQFEVNIIGNIMVMNFNLYRSGGLSLDTSYMRLNAGYRPAGPVNVSGYTEASGTGGSPRAVAAFVLDNTGGFVLKTNNGTSAITARGTMMYRIAQ